jgi:hypothetical protein
MTKFVACPSGNFKVIVGICWPMSAGSMRGRCTADEAIDAIRTLAVKLRAKLQIS